ncbi:MULTISPECIES: ATP phosphoribosyltransferase [Dietzia]|jgi:ATP phosphoribosyltransferase|uniref:ATP phosphoribosyltransferase n=3 Tax=Dietzia maris TaxID=37915 RepID=A0A365PEW2_9ACTN|nr:MULTISPECIES: ATP phosphoribosyltransferase [Dietzia]MBB0989978.1 ATP phosphoribosyltransferase [Dietzia sp. SLG510A3-30A2]MBB0993678.1 ATP phosphoribosyltransferase [Dietzia sp. SLG510A3-40A3]MBB1008472.1 ATP phosphoribosyltransferase [Dietzia sp. SLG510A3-3B2-2]ODQ83931.1 ATP phosphoribosyltransferase [Dietzia alimentaria]MCY1656897.1 ATP phosphoribosyltransferase [Dietzia sp. SL131]
MLRVALPNKGALSESASEMLAEAGYRRRHEGSKDLTLIDPDNDVEFFFLRPKDIAVYVGSGRLEMGITGRDLAADSMAEVDELLDLGFGHSTFRYAGPAGAGWSTDRLAGARIATSYPNIVRRDLQQRGVEAEVIRLDGAVEISIQLGVADCIADVVGSGRTLKVHGLEAFGDILCDSSGVLISRADAEVSAAMAQLRARLQGVVFAQQYMMLDYNCPKDLLDEVSAITPGIESPTVSPMADPAWIAVRSMVPRKRVNSIMDELAASGAKSVIATDIRSCRMG